MEINIKVGIDYDHEKQTFFVSQFEVEHMDKEGRKKERKPSNQARNATPKRAKIRLPRPP